MAGCIVTIVDGDGGLDRFEAGSYPEAVDYALRVTHGYDLNDMTVTFAAVPK